MFLSVHTSWNYKQTARASLEGPSSSPWGGSSEESNWSVGGYTASWLDVKAHVKAHDQGQGQVWEQRGSFSQGDIITADREKHWVTAARHRTALAGIQKKLRKQITHLEPVACQTIRRIQQKLGEFLLIFLCQFLEHTELTSARK